MNKRKDIVKNNLKECRQKCGYTQKQVAEILGMQCEDRLSHWEKCQGMPSVVNLIKLAKIYHVSCEELYPII